MSNLRPLEIEIPLWVKTYDIDFAGIVSNIVYVRWFEDLRLAMLAQHFPLEGQLQQGFAPVVLQTQVEYKQAITLHEKPVGRAWIQALDRLRWTVQVEIWSAQTLVATGLQHGIFINLETRRPIRIPQEMKQSYLEALAQGDGEQAVYGQSACNE